MLVIDIKGMNNTKKIKINNEVFLGSCDHIMANAKIGVTRKLQ